MLEHIKSYLSSEDFVKVVSSFFDDADEDGNNSLSPAELQKALLSIETDAIFDNFSKDVLKAVLSKVSTPVTDTDMPTFLGICCDILLLLEKIVSVKVEMADLQYILTDPKKLEVLAKTTFDEADADKNKFLEKNEIVKLLNEVT